MMRPAALLLVFALVIGGVSFAQSMPAGPEARFQRLAQELKLTDQQKLKVLLRMQAEDRRTQAIRSDASMPDGEKDLKIASERRKTLDDIRELLTPTQQARLATLTRSEMSPQPRASAR